MKKTKWVFLAVAVLLTVFPAEAWAAGNISGLEQKWLDFQRELKEKQVEDGALTKAQADAYLKELEAKLSESGEDVVYDFFKEGKKGAKPNFGLKFAEAYAKMTNRSTEDVLKACKDANCTVLQLAKKEGNLEKLKSAVVAKASEKLSQLVQAGKITKEEMQTKLKRLEEHFSGNLNENNPTG